MKKKVSGTRTIEYEDIGIVGMGFVGTAIERAYDFPFKCKTVDLDPEKTNATYADLHQCSGVFICVPSPTKDNGECDTTVLEAVLKNFKGYQGVLISKVTAPPEVYERLCRQYPNLVHVPEFLRAKHHIQDYHRIGWCFIGGTVKAYMREAERIIRLGAVPKELKAFHCKPAEAALTKYIVNSFLATKVVFMNEMKELSDKYECDWSMITTYLSQDHRIGATHMKVPGDDGFNGFGGHCFPKDTSALLHSAKKIGVNLSVLKQAVKKNTLLRLTKT